MRSFARELIALDGHCLKVDKVLVSGENTTVLTLLLVSESGGQAQGVDSRDRL
jgi:hypothetical protein